MANEIYGTIDCIGRTEQIPSKTGGQPFLKREIVIDASSYNNQTGEKYENHPAIEFNGDRCSLLDNFQKGQRVKIAFELRGNAWTRQDGTVKYITSVRGYKIELVQTKQQQPAASQPVSDQPYQTVYAQPTPPPPPPEYPGWGDGSDQPLF